jgi:RND family efflux transporter MFP subunit
MRSTHWRNTPGGRRLFVLAASAGLVLLGLASGCNQQPGESSEQQSGTATAETPEVTVGKPAKKDVRRRIERPGYNIEAYERTAIYARIPGYVQKWNADMGDRVRKDDVLAELYVPEMHVELQQKKARVRQALAEVEQANAAVLRWKAELERAKSQADRLARVGRNGVLDKEQVDEARLGSEAAAAALAKAKADVSVAEAHVDVARADQDYVESLLQYTRIPAPFDGVITRRSVNTGDLVQPAAANNAKGESLFIVEKVDPVRVFVNVQELETRWVRDGAAAFVSPQGLPGQQFQGTVTRFSGVLDPQNRTLRTEIDLPNPDGKLRPGMYVSVTIVAEHKNVWALPAAAVVTQGEQTFCYRVEGGKVVRTPVQVGLRDDKDDKLVEVVRIRTKPGRSSEEARWEEPSGEEVIVVSDPGSLSDGQAVRVASGKK